MVLLFTFTITEWKLHAQKWSSSCSTKIFFLPPYWLPHLLFDFLFGPYLLLFSLLFLSLSNFNRYKLSRFYLGGLGLITSKELESGKWNLEPAPLLLIYKKLEEKRGKFQSRQIIHSRLGLISNLHKNIWVIGIFMSNSWHVYPWCSTAQV